MRGDETETTEFDRQADRIIEEMGLTAESSPESLTYDVGFEFASRLLSSIRVTPAVAESVARDILGIYREMFPRVPDDDTREVQTYFWAPMVAKWVTGRGLTVPQIARLAGVDSDRVYRLMRMGLRICFIESDPRARTGVNRRYSGLDGRETYFILDPTGLTERPWPGEAEDYRPFIRGLMTGLQVWFADPENKAKLEPAFIRAFASVLMDPALREVFDGAAVAIPRILVDLRDQVLRMRTEKDRATELARTIAELANHKDRVFEVLTRAAGELREHSALLSGPGTL